MNLFDLFATLSLDKTKYEEGLKDAESEAESAGSGIGGSLARGLSVAGTAAAAAVGAAAAGVTKLTVASVEAYGEYEQLVGGVKKLYGDAGDALVENASKAYETAGMSANDYMQTVTSFSAALLNSLDGDAEAAVEIADMAMQDLSDNANTFGTMTAQELSNVYTGLAKGNYTLLDNLNLGFAGTQQGMLDLVNASGLFEEEITDINDVSFDQMLQAIHEVQDQMNIAGTTQNEAASTIQGSLGMLSGAWQNLVTGLGDSNADLSGLISNVVEAARTAFENILPVASQALSGIAQLIEEVAPIIAEELPSVIDQVLPSILSAAIEITTALVAALPSILSAVSDALPQIISELIPAIMTMLPQFIEVAGELVMGLAQGLIDNADLLMDAALGVVHVLVDDLLTPDNIENMISVAVELILTLSEALITHAPELIGAAIMLVSQIIVALAESLPEIASQIGNFVADLGADLGEWLYNMFGDGLIRVVDGLASWWDEVVDFAGDVLDNFVNLGADIIETIVDFMGGAGLVFNFDDMLDSVLSFGADVVDTLFGYFEEAKTTVSNAIDALLGFFDFDWSLPDIKLPHFSVSGGEAPWGIGGEGSLPSIGVEWYAKAMASPIMLTAPTIFGMSGGSLLAGGESGDEIIYGRENLMRDIREATSQQIIIPVYIGGEQIDELVVDSNQRFDFRSGGRG